MKAWVLTKGATSIDAMNIAELARPEPGPGEILVRVHACSLNYRDQAIVRGQYLGGPVAEDIVPLSDGAGEVVAVGPEDGTGSAGRFAVGDRVAGIFFQNWVDGPPNPGVGPALGAAG
ncbi:MAG TPA: alcohol dehydrogenase catalytic domain-containing protein, partial [Novosphingobium sp.]|nr:alcohol dehydrogenase catalytic domain-containing protein [Novosphingobium sp.]